MVKYILKDNAVLFCVLVCLGPLKGQNDFPVDSIINFHTATVDPLGHILYATENNEIVKLELDGKKKNGFYSNNSLLPIPLRFLYSILISTPSFFLIAI
jgi:hypothetical protein